MITQILSSLVYSTQRRTVLELIPPTLRTMWNKWDLRLSVLLSLFIHILLNILGSRRKYSRKLWISISVWSAYTVAESVTIFAFGMISNNLSDLKDKNNCGHLDLNTELATVWAQFLLLHLGGPDSITAYALEDNELWLRHFVGVVSQTCGAIYLILLTWTGSKFSILSILVFIVGSIKYGERAWVLWAASYQTHRKFVQREGVDHHGRIWSNENDKMEEEYNIKRKEGYIVSIDRFSLWLVKHKKTSTFEFLSRFKLFKSPRWSNTMSQYTLLKISARKENRGFPKIGKGECHEWNIQVTKDLKEMIFLSFKEKSEEVATTGEEPFAALPTNTNQEEEEQGRIIWEQFEYKIIIWSFATEVLYYVDREQHSKYFPLKAKAIKQISRYMLYLLVKYPSMISAETELMVVSFENIIELFESIIERWLVIKYDRKAAYEELLRRFTERNTGDGSQEVLLLLNAGKLVRELQKTAQNQERWERIGHTWMEILGYAAAKSKANEHAKQLRGGGELFTHVWLFMAQLGLTHHFQISSPEGVPPNRLIAK